MDLTDLEEQKKGLSNKTHYDDDTSHKLRVKRELHNIDIEDKEIETQLKTCCNQSTDKRLLKFIASISISMIIILFSCYQLVNIQDCSTQNLYVGLISLIVGVWIKSPTE